MSFLLSVGVAYFQYYYNTKRTGNVTLFLSALRTLVLFFLFLLLINPSIERTSYTNQKPVLSVLTDNSTSTEFFQQETLVRNTLEDFKTNSTLNEKFEINYYSFGERFQLNDSVDFKENQTNIYAPLRSVQNLHKGKKNPIVLITDGNQTLGSDYEYINSKKKVYPLVVGDTTSYEDLSIVQLNVNKYSFLNNQFPVEALLFYEGNRSVKARFTVESRGRVVYRKQLNFGPDQQTQTVALNLTSEREGVNFYTIRIEELSGEKNTANNRKNFSLEVINKQSQILILSSIYHPDLGALKKSIESDQQRKVTIKLIDDETVKLKDYQLVFVYQPTFQFKDVFEELQEQKINYFLITGTKTDWNFVSNQNLGLQKNSIEQSENYGANFNAGYLIFSQKNIGFDDFPPLSDKFGATKVSIPHQVLLYQNINGFSSEEPLLFTADENNHKKVVLLGEGLWKWRSTSFLTQNSFESFDEFLGNLVQYASSKKIRDRLNVDIENIYNANSIIKVAAFYVDSNYEFDDRATLLIRITNKETQETTSYPFSLTKNSYQVDLEGIASGVYDYTVQVEGQNIAKSGSFQVNEYSVEEQFTNANKDKLNSLAEKSGGRAFYIDNSQELIEQLINDKQYVTVQKSTVKKESLIDWKWILFLIVGLLTIEWFTRKYHGKI